MQIKGILKGCYYNCWGYYCQHKVRKMQPKVKRNWKNKWILTIIIIIIILLLLAVKLHKNGSTSIDSRQHDYPLKYIKDPPPETHDQSQSSSTTGSAQRVYPSKRVILSKYDDLSESDRSSTPKMERVKKERSTQRGPRTYMPDGRRFSVRDRHVDWQGLQVTIYIIIIFRLI